MIMARVMLGTVLTTLSSWRCRHENADQPFLRINETARTVGA
jgi:hypothetical protein